MGFVFEEGSQDSREKKKLFHCFAGWFIYPKKYLPKKSEVQLLEGRKLIRLTKLIGLGKGKI